MANWDPDRSVLIWNPAARGGELGRRMRSLEPLLREALGAIHFVPTTLNRQGGATVAQVLEEMPQVDTLLVAGGDGTFSTVCAGLLDVRGVRAADVRIGLIPMGTGGDFRRMLCDADTLSLEERVRRLPCASEALIDAGRLEREGEAERPMRWFVNSLNFGLGGEVGIAVNQSSKRWGSRLSFVLPILRKGLAYPPPLLRFTPEGRAPIVVRTNNAYAGNGVWCAGGAQPTPEALLDDGLMDVVLPSAPPTLASVSMLMDLYQGGLEQRADTMTFRTSRLLVESLDDPVRVDADGEDAGWLPLRVTMVPAVLRVLDLSSRFLSSSGR